MIHNAISQGTIKQSLIDINELLLKEKEEQKKKQKSNNLKKLIVENIENYYVADDKGNIKLVDSETCYEKKLFSVSD
jgi:hypothetical protein